MVYHQRHGLDFIVFFYTGGTISLYLPDMSLEDMESGAHYFNPELKSMRWGGLFMLQSCPMTLFEEARETVEG